MWEGFQEGGGLIRGDQGVVGGGGVRGGSVFSIVGINQHLTVLVNWFIVQTLLSWLSTEPENLCSWATSLPLLGCIQQQCSCVALSNLTRRSKLYAGFDPVTTLTSWLGSCCRHTAFVLAQMG